MRGRNLRAGCLATILAAGLIAGCGESAAPADPDPGEVSYFAGYPITLPDVSRPYLVRGVYRTQATFTVAILGDALWVASTDSANDDAPLRHQPLVLIMDEVPATVYVTAGPAP